MVQIEISKLDESLAEKAFALASSNFASQSALHLALNTDLDEYSAYLRPTFFDDVKDGLSLAATDTKSGELLGVLVARDFLKKRQKDYLPFQKKYELISELFQILEATYLQQRSLEMGDALLVDMAAVLPSHSSKGIYQTMRKEISRRAKLLGYKYVIGELTSSATQRVILEKMGHRKCAQVNLTKFSYGDRRPFESVVDPEIIVLAEETL